GSFHAHGVRTRHDPSPGARQVPRPARRNREEYGDALLSRQLDECWGARFKSGPSNDDPSARRPPETPAPTAAEEELAQRLERELWARADGASHARRRRRLHAEGRHGSRPRVHGLDDRPPAAGWRL